MNGVEEILRLEAV